MNHIRVALAALDKDFPNRYHTRGTSGRGITLLSRVPMKEASVLPIGCARSLPSRPP